MRNSKIVCTIGPSSNSEDVIRSLIQAGMDVVRINFSHGNHKEYEKIIKTIRDLSGELDIPVGILGDISGPKIRIGKIEGGSINLSQGDLLAITIEDVIGKANPDPSLAGRISTGYKSIVKDVRTGDSIILDDGTLELRVKKVHNEVLTEVIVGGLLKENKGINLPGVSLSAPAIGIKDRNDIRFAVSQGLDMIALSFVRSHKDMDEARKLLSSLKSDIPVIAKIEKWEAVADIERILSASNGIMIARGDLGVEMPPEEVPLIQKQIIAQCNRAGKPVITATQMLESMIYNPRPTRAEASDVANAIIDGSDAVMLSGETAIGKYPVESLVMMGKVIDCVERNFPGTRSRFFSMSGNYSTGILTEDAISQAATQAAKDIRASLIVAFTMSGTTARLISRHRPRVPILAITKTEEIRRRLSLVWGVRAIVVKEDLNVECMMNTINSITKEMGFTAPGDRVIFTCGLPLHERGNTNLLKVHEIT